MVLGDVFDVVVERYGGFVLLALGAIALGVAYAGYHRYLPPPWSAPIFPPRCLGCQQLTFPTSILLEIGLLSIGCGFTALPHNRRNRQAIRTPA